MGYVGAGAVHCDLRSTGRGPGRGMGRGGTRWNITFDSFYWREERWNIKIENGRIFWREDRLVRDDVDHNIIT